MLSRTRVWKSCRLTLDPTLDATIAFCLHARRDWPGLSEFLVKRQSDAMEQPTKKKLLTVAKSFYIEGRGVVVMPFIADYSGPMLLPVVLHKPNGEESVAQAELDIPRISPQPERF